MTRPTEESRLARMLALAKSKDPPPRRRPSARKLGACLAIAAAIATLLGVAGAVAHRASSASPPPPPAFPPSASPPVASPPTASPPVASPSPSTPPPSPDTPPPSPESPPPASPSSPCAPYYGRFVSDSVAFNDCFLETGAGDFVMYLRASFQNNDYDVCLEGDAAQTNVVLSGNPCVYKFATQIRKCETQDQDLWQVGHYHDSHSWRWLHDPGPNFQLNSQYFASNIKDVGPCKFIEDPNLVQNPSEWIGPDFATMSSPGVPTIGLFAFEDARVRSAQYPNTYLGLTSNMDPEQGTISAVGDVLSMQWCFERQNDASTRCPSIKCYSICIGASHAPSACTECCDNGVGCEALTGFDRTSNN